MKMFKYLKKKKMGKTDKLWGISAQRWQLYQNSKMKILI